MVALRLSSPATRVVCVPAASPPLRAAAAKQLLAPKVQAAALPVTAVTTAGPVNAGAGAQYRGALQVSSAAAASSCAAAASSAAANLAAVVANATGTAVTAMASVGPAIPGPSYQEAGSNLLLAPSQVPSHSPTPRSHFVSEVRQADGRGASPTRSPRGVSPSTMRSAAPLFDTPSSPPLSQVAAGAVGTPLAQIRCATPQRGARVFAGASVAPAVAYASATPAVPLAAAAVPGSATCPACGNVYYMPDSVYCRKCGNKCHQNSPALQSPVTLRSPAATTRPAAAVPPSSFLGSSASTMASSMSFVAAPPAVASPTSLSFVAAPRRVVAVERATELGSPLRQQQAASMGRALQKVAGADSQYSPAAAAKEHSVQILRLTETCGPQRESDGAAQCRRMAAVAKTMGRSASSQQELGGMDEAMADLQAFRFSQEDGTNESATHQPAHGSGVQLADRGPQPSVREAPQPELGLSSTAASLVPPSPGTSAAETLTRWAPAHRSLGASSAATISPPSPHSPTATASSQADALAPPSEVASSIEGGFRAPVFVARPPPSEDPYSESIAEDSATASTAQLVQLLQPAMERSTRTRREAMAYRDGQEYAYSNEASVDQFDGMRLTPLNDQPFQALSSIARQAHSVLMSRLTPRGRE